MNDPATVVDSMAEFLTAFDIDDIPPDVIEYAGLLVVDSVACALAGREGGQIGEVTGLARALGGSGDTTVIGSAELLSVAGATLLNSYLITAGNACDIYEPAFTHVTPLVVPPAMAMAERGHRTGRELLAAVVAGAEAATRVGRALDFAEFEARGWQAPGIVGPFGGAAAAARVLGLDRTGMADALALAGSQAAGTAADWGTPANKFQQFRGALSGLTAALLAAEGFPAGRGVLDRRRGGLYETYAPGEPATVTTGLGSEWELTRIGLRRWPTASGIQGVVTAIMDAATEDISANEVTEVEIAVSPQVYARHGGVSRPEGRFQRLQSIHYVAAVSLVDGRLWLDQFADERAQARDLAQLLERVTVRGDARIHGAGADVLVRCGEREIARDCAVPQGHPSNPLGRGEVEEKFRAAGHGRVPGVALDQAGSLLSDLSRVGDCAQLMRWLGSSTRG